MPVTRSQKGTGLEERTQATEGTITEGSGATMEGTTTEGTFPSGTSYETTTTGTTLEGHQEAPLTAGGDCPAQKRATEKPKVAKGKSKAMSVASSNRVNRKVLEARAELARLELEEARAAAALARTRLEMLQLDEDEESGSELNEPEDRDKEVQKWVSDTVGRMSKEEQPAKVKPMEEPFEDSAVKPEVTSGGNPTEGTKELARAIVEAISSTPKGTSVPGYLMELPYYDGSSGEWLAFKTVYEDTAGSFTAVQNMARLRRSIKGAAREVVKSLLYTECAPEEVMEALRRRFGRPDALVLAEMDKLRNLPKIGENAKEVCIFASQVNNIVATVKGLKKPQYLQSPEMLKTIVDKMPAVLRYRWFDFTAENEDPDLVHLGKFLNREADRCGPYAIQEAITRKAFTGRREATHAAIDQDRESCPHCRENHKLYGCKKFLEASVKQRWEIAAKSKLCFKCLQGRHRKEDCKRPSCKTCNRWHHSLLHEERPQGYTKSEDSKEKEVANNVLQVNTVKSMKAYLKMVPVELYGPKGTARVLALLDEGSTVTMLDSSVAKQLGLQGPKEALTLETVGGKLLTNKDSMKINVVIKGVHHTRKRTISGVRTIDELRLTPQQMDKKRIEELSHLRKMANQLYYEEEPPKLLIGQDNWELIVSRGTRKGKRNEPVASLTYLGWVLHGSDSGARQVNFLTCAHVFAREEEWDRMIKEHFALESLGVQQRKPTTDAEGRALEILGRSTRRLENGRFEVGLLWKIEDEKMQDNYKSAENRLKAIERKLDKDLEFKEADDATRDVPKDFDGKHRWFTGPAFLREEEESWPKPRNFKSESTGEEKATFSAAVQMVDKFPTPDPARFSSWNRLLRATARVLQFISLCRKEIHQVNISRRQEETDPTWKKNKKKQKIKTSQYGKKEERKFLPIEETHINEAEKLLIQRSQEESFKEEISSIRKMKMLDRSSKLKKIDVVMEDGLLLIRGRIDAASGLGEAFKRPVVLDSKNNITRLLIAHYHRVFNHGNHATVMNELRQRYWILGLRSAVRATAHECQWCKVYRSAPQIPPTGNLPKERLCYGEPAFTCSAVDYFGPMMVTVGRRHEKRWGALFTCLTTRAVHVELAATLSSSSMILALRRMAARRGMPKTIFSDNGTNFVGANKELKEAIEELKKEEIVTEVEKMGLKWKFIAPGAPNMGGAWERLVRSIKKALEVTLRERCPKEEVLHTLVLEAEHIVNSRPLVDTAEDQLEEALTPNHFLIGRSCGLPRIGVFHNNDLISRRDWKMTQRLIDHFWGRWVKEYLPTLIPRRIDGKVANRDLQCGDTVLIVDSTLPRGTWPRGQVIQTYPGPDGRTRVVEVKTTGGVLRRPSSKAVLLVPGQSCDRRVDESTGTGASSSGVAEPGVGAAHEGEDVGDGFANSNTN